ncbi:MAG: permease [Acidimicrobiales bacterium]
MTEEMSAPTLAGIGRHYRRNIAAAGVLFVLVTLGGLIWAKWWPYAHKVAHVLSAHALGGTSTLTGKAKVPPQVSWHAAWSFSVTYFDSIWIALVAALVIAAAAEAFVPRRWLVRQLSRGPQRLGGAAAGGLASLPSLMCTCCTAPLAVTLRRRGVPPSSALAYWVGNPMLNPVVLIFLAVVLPWQWVGVRIVGGLVLVFVATTVAARFDRRQAVQPTWSEEETEDEPFRWAAAWRRFARALLRLAATLLPEYLVVVLLVGGLRGWLFPLGHGVASWGVLGLLLFAVAGALFVIPTAGEIPIIVGLLAAGVGVGAVGVLVITLPALSLPSLAMVSRSFSVRTLSVLVGAVIVVGVAVGFVLEGIG